MNTIKKEQYEIPDQKLEQVSGGWYTNSVTYKTKEEVVFKWNVNDHVEKITSYPIFHIFTEGYTVVERKADVKKNTNGFCAWYKIKDDDGTVLKDWFQEDDFEGGYISIHLNNDL